MFRCFVLVVLKLTFRLLPKVRSRIWALLSAICPKVSLFFASSFKVSFQNATNDESWGLGSIICYLSQSCGAFLLVLLRLPSRMLRMVIARVGPYILLFVSKSGCFFI